MSQLHPKESRADRLEYMVTAVWLLGVIFAVVSVLLLLFGYALEAYWFEREQEQTQKRLSTTWKKLQKQLKQPVASDGLIPLRFSTTGQLEAPLHLAPPSPKALPGRTRSSSIISADKRARQRWKKAQRAQRAGDISRTLQLLRGIPPGTYAANGIPLDLLALFRRWQLQDEQAQAQLFKRLERPHYPISIRTWMLREIDKRPGLRHFSRPMLQRCRESRRRWQGIQPPGPGKWMRHQLDGIDGIVYETTTQSSAWLSHKRLAQRLDALLRTLIKTGRIIPVLSLRTHQSAQRPHRGRSMAAAGPLVIQLQRKGWTQSSWIWVAFAAIVVLLLFLLLAGIAIKRLFRRERQLQQEQQRFAAAVAHELRSPLTSLNLTAELLASETVPPEKLQTYHQRLEEQVQRLRGVVDNVISFYRKDAKTPTTKSYCPLHDAMKAIVESLHPQASRAGIKLELEWHPPSDQRVPIGESALTRIAFNLFDNALKHAPGSNVTIAVGPGPRLVFSDEGPGIPATLQQQVFQPFTQGASHPDTDARQGLGLGLAFIQEAVERTDGTITLDSSPTRGTSIQIDWSHSHDT